MTADVTVIGTWRDADEVPSAGTVYLQRHDTIQEPGSTVIFANTERADLDADGQISLVVVGADADDPNPLTRFYRVIERIKGNTNAVVYDIELDETSGTVDLTTVARVEAVPDPVYLYMTATEVAAAIATAIEGIEVSGGGVSAADLTAAIVAAAVDYAKLAGGNTFSGEQVLANDVPLIGAADAAETDVVRIASAKYSADGIERTMAALFAAALDLGGGFTVRNAGLTLNEYNPLAGDFTDRVCMVSYGFSGVDGSGNPVYRLRANISDSEALSDLMSAPAQQMTVGEPDQDGDATTKLYVDTVAALKADATALAAKADQSAVDAALALKADQSAVDAALALKADQTDLDALETTVDGLSGGWQPLVPTNTTASVLQSDIIAGTGVLSVDPSVMVTGIVLSSNDAFDIEVQNPGAGKFATFFIQTINPASWVPVVDFTNKTTGAASGQLDASKATAVFLVTVYGGESAPSVVLPTRFALF